MSALEKNAIVAILSASNWNASKTDKRLADALTAEYEANDGTAKVRKQLIPKEALRDLSRAIQSAKMIHHLLTLPYGDHGDRLLPIKQIQKYKIQMHAAIEEVEIARKEFIEAYDAGLAEESLKGLGRMGDRRDYPSGEELKSKFGVSYELLPVPSASHFIADVGDEERERITADLERRNEAKLNTAMVTLYERIESELRRLIERLGVDENGNPSRIHASALEAIKSLAMAVPDLNLSNDPQLNLIASKIQAAIGTIEIGDLRHRTKKPSVVQHVTETREGLSKELTSIAAAYFGPEVKTAAIESEATEG